MQFYPKEHAADLQRRKDKKKQCPICEEYLELLSSEVCKPCFSTGGCKTCSDIDPRLDAAYCEICSAVREKLGAKHEKQVFDEDFVVVVEIRVTKVAGYGEERGGDHNRYHRYHCHQYHHHKVSND